MKAYAGGHSLRNYELSAIHIAKAGLGLSDDEYRDVMQATVGARSAADLDDAQRRRFLAHLDARLRAGGIGRKGDPITKGRPKWSPRQRRLWSLWQQLADANLVADRRREALAAWVRRQTSVDRMEWLTDPQLDTVIEAAKLWLRRAADSLRSG